jgi:hypothetical protein
MIASNTTIPDPVAWYSSHAASLAPVYEAIDPAKGYAWLAEQCLPFPHRDVPVQQSALVERCWPP